MIDDRCRIAMEQRYDAADACEFKTIPKIKMKTSRVYWSVRVAANL